MKITDIEQVFVGGFVYNVRADNETNIYLTQNNLQAEHDPFTMEFKVSTALSEQGQAQSLVHEVIHAIVRVYGAQDVCEPGVEALSQGIFQVLRDNPNLVVFIATAGDSTVSTESELWRQAFTEEAL
jgi:hypothetical protein